MAAIISVVSKYVSEHECPNIHGVRLILITSFTRDQSDQYPVALCSAAKKMSLHAVLDTYVAELTAQAGAQTLNWLRRHH